MCFFLLQRFFHGNSHRNGHADHGVVTVSNKENIDTSTPTGKLMLTMIGAINEFERTNLLERQREGIAIAKREGKYKGGKHKEISNFEGTLRAVYGARSHKVRTCA